MHSDTAIIIPSRLGSQRLHKKPLQPIGSFSMIEHVLNQVKLTNLQNIYVATDSQLIADRIIKCNGKVIITDENCSSGTDRIYQAFQLIPNNYNIKYIVNVQGDMPFIRPDTILQVIKSLKSSAYDIITPVVKVGLDIANSSSNVKVVTDNYGKALYFSRSIIPYGACEFLYHIGIYGFHKSSLMKFITLPLSSLEQSENLEQLRAIQNNMNVGVCYVDNIPLSVDTEEDLNKAIEFYNQSIYLKSVNC